MGYFPMSWNEHENQLAYKHQLRKINTSWTAPKQRCSGGGAAPSTSGGQQCSRGSAQSADKIKGFRTLDGDKLRLKSRLFCLQHPVMCSTCWRAALVSLVIPGEPQLRPWPPDKAELSLPSPRGVWLIPDCCWVTEGRAVGLGTDQDPKEKHPHGSLSDDSSIPHIQSACYCLEVSSQ